MKALSMSFLAIAGMVVTSAAATAQVELTGHAECCVPESAAPACAAPSMDYGCTADGCANNCIGYSSCNWSSGCNSCNNFFGGGCLNSGACQSGSCLFGNCNGIGCPAFQFGNCGPGNGCMTNSCLSNSLIGRCCGTKAYPDSGWAPPAHLPVNRDRIWYGSYYPQAFYGSPGGGFVASYPQVYQPTDTTQLGYYYANVPTWQSRPGMIPSVPVPSQFHARVCPGSGVNGCQTGNCHRGYVHTAGYMPQNQWRTAAVSNHKPQIIRPQIAESGSRSRNWLRLSSLTELFD